MPLRNCSNKEPANSMAVLCEFCSLIFSKKQTRSFKQSSKTKPNLDLFIKTNRKCYNLIITKS